MTSRIACILLLVSVAGIAQVRAQQADARPGTQTGGCAADSTKNCPATVPAFDTPPTILHQVKAEFSDAASIQIKESGLTHFGAICILSVDVDTKGKPQDVKVVRPAPYDLNEQAIKAVRKYKFKPALKEGKPVEARIFIEINFQLYF
jgi:TonB family protein